MALDGVTIAEAQVRDDLSNLLRFAAGLLEAREPDYDVSKYPTCLTEDELRDAAGALWPGIAIGAPLDAWLSVDRLGEHPPPAPPATLAPWLRAEARQQPGQPPVLLDSHTVEVSAEAASDLVEAGLAEAEAIAEQRRGLKADGPVVAWLVPLRPAELPDLVAAREAYVAGVWHDWSEAEAPRRRTIRLYETLFKAQQQIQASGSDAMELIAGLGLACWQCGGQKVNLPLIEQRCEFDLNEVNGRLCIRPREALPEAALSAFVSLGVHGADDLQREMTRRLEQIARDPDIVLGPAQPAAFRDVLETCAARLDASGTVLAAEDPLGAVTDRLRISPTLCVLVRPRRADRLRENLNRLRQHVQDPAVRLPETARRFVVEPSGQLPTLRDGARSGHGWDDGGGGERTSRRSRLFFPLAANAEQEEILRRLEQDDVAGVIAQGPPGTGKTHTIANVIGHWLASGRSVLVSANKAAALAAVREKLPAVLQTLVVAATHTDREGILQQEQAVKELATGVLSYDVRQGRARLDGLERMLERDEARLAEVDAALDAIARDNLAERPWRGSRARPDAIAAWVAAQGDRHAWLTDPLDLTGAFEPAFGEAEMVELRSLRRRLGEDLAYRAEALTPEPTLPSLGDVMAAHRALLADAQRVSQEHDGSLPRLDVTQVEPGEPASMVAWLERLAAWGASCGEHPWLPRLWLARAQGAADPVQPLLHEAAGLAREGDRLGLLALALGDIAEGDRLALALDRLAAGLRPFGIFAGLRRSPVREAIDDARIAGSTPADAAAWTHLRDLHAWRRSLPGFVARWNALAGQFGLSALPNVDVSGALCRLGRLAATMMELAVEAQERHRRLRLVFPYGIDADAVIWRIEVAPAVAALRANLGSSDVAQATRLRAGLCAGATAIGGPFAEGLCQVAEALGTAETEEAELAAEWVSVRDEAQRLPALRGDLARATTLARQVRDSGAPAWAERLRSEPPRDGDALLPHDWRDAWDCARARTFLARVTDRGRAQALATERAELVRTRERAMLELIEQRIYL